MSESLLDNPRSKNSLSRNAMWAVGGNLFFGAGRFLIIVILIQSFASDQVGQVLYGLAVVTPLAFLFYMELRTIYVTDTKGWTQVGHCLATRLGSNFVLLFFLALLGLLGWKFAGWQEQQVLIIFLVGAVRMAESWADIYLGVMQKSERMKNWAISQCMKTSSVLIWAGFLPLLNLDIWWLLVGWAAVTFVVLWFYDRPVAAKLADLKLCWDHRISLKLVLLGLPLGVFVAMAILNQNVAQYFIEAKLGVKEVAYFGALLGFVWGLQALQNGVNQSVLGRLAVYFSRDIKEFWALLMKLLGCSWLFLSLVLALVWWRGDLLLQTLYGEEYAQNADLFVVVMGAGMVIFTGMTLGDAILACHRFKSRMLAVGCGLAVNVLLCGLFVGRFGLAAAAWSTMAAATVTVLVSAAVLIYATREQSARQKLQKEQL
ncbi:MAG: hypothetical protein JXD22_11140 [Sedimentisphaerales bacterium]|nr:hypothetical protein [Sedimentisphaerales bacterium]